MPRLLCAVMAVLFMALPVCSRAQPVQNEGAPEAALTPFASDGCSRFPDGTPSDPTRWRHCCVAHDVAYWAGGSRAERSVADQALQACVAKAANPILAGMMRLGVKVGGSPHLPTAFRWGFGWPRGRGYKALTRSERQQVEQLMPGFPQTAESQ